MDIIKSTYKKRETYRITFDCSLLYECALSIAAVTNTPLIDTLERPLQAIRKKANHTLQKQLNDVEVHNTWKALLQLLHQDTFSSLNSFTSYINSLNAEQLRFVCLPYLGYEHEEDRKKAANGDKSSIQMWQKETADHPFYSPYISFITSTDTDHLKEHLVEVMTLWYEEMVRPQEEKIEKVLQKDIKDKQRMLQKIDPESFVKWATGGIQYSPEPSVYEVVLIPHQTYRPWNLEADLNGKKVFYYPVSNQSMEGSDAYTPSQFLVQKYKALGDENRLKILKYMTEGEKSLQELTDLMGIGKTTVHHHLKMLKSARVIENNRQTYRLVPHTLDTLPHELQQFLDGETYE
ncbi:metalloregulator ArsR/SmtB family transcription factor [Halobacillus sp. Marseille-Q1614]|uniref:ArsR/SmtB family transcription factor n=1 Tax=Halobacillus sp. Marseille-Q1614 TaxID=2709134 RepID=UPI00157155DF|nr:metalloregulator ArsR/SmtB family transcription factor [Halobacillus sp. Marseille-Q1614]